jgi:hypothetical protein
MVRLLSGLTDSKSYLTKFNVYFLIYSLLIIDGQYVLEDREKNLKDLYEFFMSLSQDTYRAILKETEGLRTSSYDVIKYLEGYTYTDDSRRVWKILNGKCPNEEVFTGIPGTGKLGINLHQEQWIYINRILDTSEEYDTQFGLALMVASASNPKGVKQIRSRHDSTTKNAEDRRKKLADVGCFDSKEWRPDGWAVSVDTAEDLLAELDRQMSGKKDKHDVFMENYLRKMRESAEAKTRKAKEDIERVMKEHEGEFVLGGESRAATKEEVEELFRGKKKKNTGVVSVQSEDAASEEDKERFITKTGGRVLTGRG